MSDTDIDDSISIDTEEYAICDEVEEVENEYIECVNDKYYIGSYCIMKDNIYNDMILFGRKIHLSTFYAFSNYELSTYIYFCSGLNYRKKPTIEIMQLKIGKYGIYTAIIKTFWIKMIQRAWKKRMAQKKQYISNIERNILSLLHTFQLTNQLPKPLGLYGLLSNMYPCKKI
jgi:hypothetical protein